MITSEAYVILLSTEVLWGHDPYRVPVLFTKVAKLVQIVWLLWGHDPYRVPVFGPAGT